MTARQLRLLRAGAASAVATLIAAVSHTLGGGAAPHPLLIVAVTAFVLPLSALLIGSRPARGRVAATIAVAQTGFHLAFQFLGSSTEGMPGGVTPQSGHTHHLELPATLAAALPVPDAAMIGAHVLAAVLTTLLVWHGEAILRAIAGWVLALLGIVTPPTLAEHEAPAAPVTVIRSVARGLFSDVAPRRGPPALLRG